MKDRSKHTPTGVRNTGVLTVIVLAALLLMGCGSPTGPNIPSLNETNLTLKGSFTKPAGAGGGTVDFVAVTGDPIRAITDNDYALTGLIEDGAITMRLNGYYNSSTGTYSLSADSSFIIYQINGTFNASGGIDEAEATIRIKASGEVYVISSISQNNTVTVDDSVIDTSGTGGIPPAFQGIWYESYNGGLWYYMISGWGGKGYYKNEYTAGQWVEDTEHPLSILEIAQINANEYSAIIAYMDFDYDEIEGDYPGGYHSEMFADFADERGINVITQAQLDATNADPEFQAQLTPLNDEYWDFSDPLNPVLKPGKTDADYSAASQALYSAWFATHYPGYLDPFSPAFMALNDEMSNSGYHDQWLIGKGYDKEKTMYAKNYYRVSGNTLTTGIYYKMGTIGLESVPLTSFDTLAEAQDLTLRDPSGWEIVTLHR